MPQFGDFLNRFRPAGTPGAASRAGVPADRAAELSAELAPVLTMLAAADGECARVVAEAEQEATGIADRARTEVARIEADGRARADAARAEAGAAVLAAARAAAAELERAASAQVQARPGPTDADAQALILEALLLVRTRPARALGQERQ